MRILRRALLLASSYLLCLPWFANAQPFAPNRPVWCAAPPPFTASAPAPGFDLASFLRPDSGHLIGTPSPSPATGCQANLTCNNGCVIGCTGNTLCTVGNEQVTCDGNTTYCPYPTCDPPDICVDKCGYCECMAIRYQPLICIRNYCNS
jgi:hypothetical protein